MWWLVIPVIGVVGKAIYDAAASSDKPASQNKTLLELNLSRLKRELGSCSGQKIAILGQPGAGKSSLLKRMTNNKAVPEPVIGTQTDATCWAKNLLCPLLSSFESYIFSDVPGYDTVSHPAPVFSELFPFANFDAFIFVCNGKLYSADEEIFRLAASSGKPICIARSFSDGLDSDEKSFVQNDINSRFRISGDRIPIIFFSNRSGDGIYEISRFLINSLIENEVEATAVLKKQHNSSNFFR
jgi:predicted GTPase